MRAGAAALSCALTMSAPPAFADAQSDALAQAQRACHDITLTAAKRTRALNGWTEFDPTPKDQGHVAANYALLYGVIGDAPYPTSVEGQLALLPDLLSAIEFEQSEVDWLVQSGTMAFYGHDTGWSVAVTTYLEDDTTVTCVLWHDDLSDDSRALIDEMTGIFPSYNRPFQTLTEISAWVTRGIYDHDLFLSVSFPRQDLYDEFADVYLTFETYGYDLTEDY